MRQKIMAIICEGYNLLILKRRLLFFIYNRCFYLESQSFEFTLKIRCKYIFSQIATYFIKIPETSAIKFLTGMYLSVVGCLE